MLTISPEFMLLMGALFGFVGFANILLSMAYGVFGFFHTPEYDSSKIKTFTDEEWPSTGEY